MKGDLKYHYGLITVVDSVASSNAPDFQITPTYDGSGQCVHPDIYYNSSGWNGYKYWMVMSPYPNNDETKENPSILVSNDGATWAVPGGLVNPIEPAPPSGNNADTDIFLGYDGKLYVIFIHNETLVSGTLYAMSSNDGITWSAKTQLWTGGYLNVVSPSMVLDNNMYIIYYVDCTSGIPQVKRRTCSTVTGTWSSATDVTINGLAAGRLPWHLDVNKYNYEYHMLLTTASGIGGADSKLNFGTSFSDKKIFTVKTDPILDVGAGAAWDNDLIYRSTAILMNDGSDDYYDLWYSARKNGVTWHVGLTQIAFDLVASMDLKLNTPTGNLIATL